MLKLYKTINGRLHYWETWSTGTAEIVHLGPVGQRGEDKTITDTPLVSAKHVVQQQINLQLQDGYEEMEIEDQYTLLIEYQINDMGTPADLDKRHRLEQRLDQTLGWTGLGNCNGGSTGSGTMEICCYVVDFDLAKQVIEADLKGTEFADYLRIFDENDD